MSYFVFLDLKDLQQEQYFPFDTGRIIFCTFTTKAFPFNDLLSMLHIYRAD